MTAARTGAAARAALVLASLVSAACGDAPRASPAAGRGAISADGLAVSEFAGASLRRRLRAEQLLVVPRRLGPFQVAGLDELVLTHARIELFEAAADPAGEAGPGAIVPRRTIETVAAGRRIAGASIYDLACDLVRDGELRARVSAAHGKLDARSGDVVLDDFGVVQLRPVARSVRGARALWRGRDGEIVIPGAYELREGGRVTTGTGLRLRLGGVPRATE